jgi:hypothetical protein
MIVMKEKEGELVSYTRLPDEDPSWDRQPVFSIYVVYMQKEVEAKIAKNDAFFRLI